MIDIHAHYDDEKFDVDREVLLTSLFNEHGVKSIVNAGCNIESSLFSISLAEKYENVYAAVGFHPQEVDMFSEESFEQIKKMLSHPKVVAIGEIGLDYHYGTDDKEQQKEMFRKQLQLAVDTNMPVIIHERDCVADCLEIVFDYDVRGVFHAFSGSKETAKLLLDRGWYISFTGTVTFKNAKFPVENAAYVPEDRILTETDAPYLTAHPFRGKRNDSSYMKYTIEKIAEIRNTTFEHIERVTEENAKRLFGI
ncbi:MAG: TatD family hydrolase [Clostridia bacterium]|nr:TatD family hydrolase [Clostridia bacterium]